MCEKFIKFIFVFFFLFSLFFFLTSISFLFSFLLTFSQSFQDPKGAFVFPTFLFCFFPRISFFHIRIHYSSVCSLFIFKNLSLLYSLFFFLFSDKLHKLTNYAGEAVYADDIPSPTNFLHGAFIYSTKPFARVKGIKLKPQSVADRVSALISFKDIPGENIGAKNSLGSEPLFADEFTRCAGQYIAFVVIP